MALQGTYTALVTPLKDNDIHLSGLIENVHFQLDANIDGFLVLGSTGEETTLSSKEQDLIISTVIKEVDRKKPVIVNVSHSSTEETINRACKAENQGADYLLICTPYFNKPTQEGIYRHFKAVCKKTSLPIIVYNIMSRTGVNIETNTMCRIAELPNVCGAKESSGNIQQIGDVIHQLAYMRSDFSVLSGDDPITFPLMALGGQGVISVASNLLPREVSQMVKLMLQGHIEDARKLHFQLLEFFHLIFIETNPIPIKTAMNFSGMAAGSLRLPLCELRPENAQKIFAWVEAKSRKSISCLGTKRIDS